MNLSQAQKTKLIAQFPELRSYFEHQETMGALKNLANQPKFPPELIAKIKAIKGDKGDAGYTPVKGKDYFTETELNQIVSYIKDRVVTPDLLQKSKGKDGINGNDYVLTDKDKKDIAKSIDVPIVEKIIEKTEVIKEIHAKPIDVSSVKGAASKKDLEASDKKLLDGMIKIDGRIKAVDMRWHGAGLSRVTTDTTLTGLGTPASPLSVVGGSGTGFQLPTSGSVNGINLVFGWVTAPNAIVVDGVTIQKVSQDSTVNWTGTTITTLVIAPNFSVFSVA